MSGKRYNKEFKKQVVSEYIKGRSTKSICEEYGIAKSTVSEWANKYSEKCQYIKEDKVTDIITINEIRELNKKIAELEKENSFLKKAAAFFAKEIN